MDQIFQTILPSLGAFAPAAVLAWWIIRTQQRVIEQKDARIEKLTDQVISLGSSTAQVLAELRAAVKG